MNLLLINSANEELTILLCKNNKLFFCAEKNKQHHNEIMLTKIDQLLTEHNLKIQDIDEFGVVLGPGSFTGIRVGVATVLSFKDALQKSAFGLNNLDLLFYLAKNQNENVNTVAILGSKDCYFVAKMINGIIYKYEHKLTLNELKQVAENKSIGMFSADENVNCFVVKFDAKVMLDCYLKNKMQTLTPIYYQLSQAENEKLKHAKIKILSARKKDLKTIAELENRNIKTNKISQQEIENMFVSKNYKFFVAEINEKLVGYIILQITDEVNITSIAVEKQFRNIGVASLLIKRGEKFAKTLLNKISLDVSENNISAYLLYKKLGYVIRRKRKNYYEDGSTCFEMEKNL